MTTINKMAQEHRKWREIYLQTSRGLEKIERRNKIREWRAINKLKIVK